MIQFIVLFIVGVAVAILMVSFYISDNNLLDRPRKDHLERVTKIIPYLETYSYGYAHKTVEEQVEDMLKSRKVLRIYEDKVAAKMLVDQHHPENLKRKIKELEDELGIGDGNGVAPVRPKSWWKRS